MTKILALLQNIAPLLDKTILRQMSHVIFGMLAISGRITMKSLLEMVGATISLTYLVLNGHFGNYPSTFMVRRME